MPFFPLPFVDIPGPLLVGAVFCVLVLLQGTNPLRCQRLGPLARLTRNLALALPAVLLLRVVLIPIPYAVALWAHSHRVGVLHWVPLPALLAWFAGVAAFDYASYWWHVGLHRVPLLWRLHNVHHTDLDMDVSTAARFHFLEVFLSVPYRVAVVLLTGIAPGAYLLYELLFEIATQFHHSNWRLPHGLERALGALVITPRLHGIHHSIVQTEANSNWGTLFSWWDRLHGSRRDDIAQDDLTIGVPAYRDERELTLGALLALPLRAPRPWVLPDGAVPERTKDTRGVR